MKYGEVVPAKYKEDVPAQKWNWLLWILIHSLTVDEKLHCPLSGVLQDNLSLDWKWRRRWTG